MDKQDIHFIGIGGIGVSSLARYFLAQNWAVSGSDASKSNETRELVRDGAKVLITHKPSNLNPKTNLVVFSQAIPADNPEIVKAKRLGIPVISYPEALGELTKQYRTIAISGSHGKSTTTAITSLIFRQAGLDPTVIVGTKLKEFGGRNFRLGKGPYLIIEADEYKDSFLNYHPEAILMTNIDREHLDHYKNFTGVKRGFKNFSKNLDKGGVMILNRDDSPVRNLFKSDKRVIWYSLKDKKTSNLISKVIKIPGRHNVSNFSGAFKLARHFGISQKNILKAISSFKGSWRRMEYRGQFKIQNSHAYRQAGKFKAKVYDDYAHHPTEIKATLSALREAYHTSPLLCVFQPHQSKRLKVLFKEFTESFKEADITLILPIYFVAGRDVELGKWNSEALVKAIQKKYPKQKTFYLKDPKNLRNALQILIPTFGDESCAPSLVVNRPANRLGEPVIVMMGAGDVVNITPSLLE